MSRVAYVNGRYVPHGAAQVHVEDRGYQFADGVYEVTAVTGGRLVDNGPHMERLDRSLRELGIAWPMSPAALTRVQEEVIRRNRVREGIVYLQVTRGVARRDHAFPVRAAPALVVTARHAGPPKAAQVDKGVKVILQKDIRWGRCDIKSVALLPNVLAKQAAREAGAFEAWLVDDEGFVTEGSSTNAWIVDADGNLVTRHLENAILSGVTRRILVELAATEGHKIVERPFTPAEAMAAPEAFLTSTTSFVMPVVQIDETPVGTGIPGPVTLRLRALYETHVQRG
jgi:D-alanine transaminase